MKKANHKFKIRLGWRRKKRDFGGDMVDDKKFQALLEQVKGLDPEQFKALVEAYEDKSPQSEKKASVYAVSEQHLAKLGVNKTCPACGSATVVHNGVNEAGIQRFKCQDFGKSFTRFTDTLLEKSHLLWEVWGAILKMMPGCCMSKKYVTFGRFKNDIAQEPISARKIEGMKGKVKSIPQICHFPAFGGTARRRPMGWLAPTSQVETGGWLAVPSPPGSPWAASRFHLAKCPDSPRNLLLSGWLYVRIISTKKQGGVCMALVKCPECGRDVSSFADSCPNCGCPTSKMGIAPPTNHCRINGKLYDLTRALELSKNSTPDMDREKIRFINQVTGMALIDCLHLGVQIKKEGKVPFEYAPTCEASSGPKCPTCGSTDLTKLGIGTRAVSGAIFGTLSVEGRAQFRCNKCGYQW